MPYATQIEVYINSDIQTINCLAFTLSFIQFHSCPS